MQQGNISAADQSAVTHFLCCHYQLSSREKFCVFTDLRLEFFTLRANSAAKTFSSSGRLIVFSSQLDRCIALDKVRLFMPSRPSATKGAFSSIAAAKACKTPAWPESSPLTFRISTSFSGSLNPL